MGELLHMIKKTVITSLSPVSYSLYPPTKSQHTNSVFQSDALRFPAYQISWVSEWVIEYPIFLRRLAQQWGAAEPYSPIWASCVDITALYVDVMLLLLLK